MLIEILDPITQSVKVFRREIGFAKGHAIAFGQGFQRSEIALATSNFSALHPFLYSIEFAPGDGVLYESIYPENQLITIVPAKS